VAPAINLNRKTEFLAMEVHNVLVHRPLTIEVVTTHLFSPELCPEQRFRAGHIPAQCAGAFLQDGIVRDDPIPHDGT
jgi:hypothetical protein